MVLDSAWGEHLTRRVNAVQSALRTNATLPPFPAAGAMPSGGAPASESDPRVRWQIEPRYTDARATENPQTTGGRDVTPPGRSGVSLTQPSAASATSEAILSMSTGAEDGVASGVPMSKFLATWFLTSILRSLRSLGLPLAGSYCDRFISTTGITG